MTLIEFAQKLQENPSAIVFYCDRWVTGGDAEGPLMDALGLPPTHQYTQAIRTLFSELAPDADRLRKMQKTQRMSLLKSRLTIQIHACPTA